MAHLFIPLAEAHVGAHAKEHTGSFTFSIEMNREVVLDTRSYCQCTRIRTNSESGVS